MTKSVRELLHDHLESLPEQMRYDYLHDAEFHAWVYSKMLRLAHLEHETESLQELARAAGDVSDQVRRNLLDNPEPWFLDALVKLEGQIAHFDRQEEERAHAQSEIDAAQSW